VDDDPAFDAQITFLFVADLARSADFYGETLGLELIRDQGTCHIYRVSDRAFLGLCDHRPPEPGGLIVTLVTDDVDPWADRLRAAGHDVDGPTVNERYAIYHCFVRDPDGHLVEIQRFDRPL
jgi:catechol 2,3-dioxygenase-like lactoylglutathione lyase family enzyme